MNDRWWLVFSTIAFSDIGNSIDDRRRTEATRDIESSSYGIRGPRDFFLYGRGIAGASTRYGYKKEQATEAK